jgi:hypothetical protein
LPDSQSAANFAKIINVNSLKRFLKSLLFSAFFYRPVISLFAQGTFSVVSTNDGNGQFSWIFSASGGSFPELDQFKMKLYGVEHASSPDGWAATIDSDEFVTWNYLGTSGAPFTGSPMILSIHSISTQPILYGGIGNVVYPDGLYSGAVFGRFMYEGPQQVPEPTSSLFFVVAAVAHASKRSFSRQHERHSGLWKSLHQE